MSRRVIARQEWPSFVDGFSRRHEGWLVSLARLEPSGAHDYVAREVRLRGVVAELGHVSESMMVFTGDTMPHTAHFIERPVAISVDETADGSEAALRITDAGHTTTIIEFRSPMRPELVDGIVSP